VICWRETPIKQNFNIHHSKYLLLIALQDLIAKKYAKNGREIPTSGDKKHITLLLNSPAF